MDGAIILDIDLATGCFHDALDHLALRADHRADLLGVDLDAGDPRGVLGQLLAWGIDRGSHILQDLEPGLAGLVKCLAGQLQAQAGDLDIGLEPGDSFAGAGDLEIHIAEVVLGSKDICQGDLFLAVLARDQPDRDPGHRRFERHAGIHHRQGRAADRGHGGRPV